jgi:hypothetical protein
MHISRQVAGTLIAGRSTTHLRRRMSRRLVYKLTRRVLPWAPTKVRSKRMRWRWTSISFPRRRGTRFSTREKGTKRKLRTRPRRMPKRPRRRKRRKARKVRNQGSPSPPVATQDRIIPYYAPNSSIKHSKNDSKDRSQEIL